MKWGNDKYEVRREFMSQYGKDWVRVSFTKPRHSATPPDIHYDWVPSFEDLYWIVRLIADCEEDKYPHGVGRWMVEAFLRDTVGGLDFEFLKQKYLIPIRRDGPIRLVEQTKLR